MGDLVIGKILRLVELSTVIHCILSQITVHLHTVCLLHTHHLLVVHSSWHHLPHAALEKRLLLFCTQS